MIRVESKVDHNDGNCNVKINEFSGEKFDEFFDVICLVAKIINVPHGLKSLFKEEEEINKKLKYEISDYLYEILPFCEEYANYGNNCFGHTLHELNVTYFDADGVEYVVDILSPLE